MKTCLLIISLLTGWAGMLCGAESSPAAFKIRGTLPWHNFLSGPTAWNEVDYEQYLDRCKELGLNYVAFHCYTGGAERYVTYVEPLIRIRYRDVVPEATLDTSMTARWGYRPLPLSEFAFGSAKSFNVPAGARAFGADCAILAQSNEDRYQRAQGLMKRVIEMAHARDIKVAIGFEYGMHPPEFASIVPPDSRIPGSMRPDPTHASSIEILHATLDDILRTYPGLDGIWLWLNEFSMIMGSPRVSGKMSDLVKQDAVHFLASRSDVVVFNGLWALAYIRETQRYLEERKAKVQLVISGWGGGNQLNGILEGLDKALPKDIVFTCLNPDQGAQSHPPVLAEIAKHRTVWAMPWLEGDAQLWHLQPRVAMLREQIRQAQDDKLAGVVAIHWRTEDIRPNFEAFARFARDPSGAPSVEEFYRQDCEKQYGKAAAPSVADYLIKLETDGFAPLSPEYYPYAPFFGRINPAVHDQLDQEEQDLNRLARSNSDVKQRKNLEWLAANLRFTVLLDEVSRKMEPAYRLRERWLGGEVAVSDLAADKAAARVIFESAPIEACFNIYSQRVRSRGELGVLSALNQKVWLQYRELQSFLAATQSDKP